MAGFNDKLYRSKSNLIAKLAIYCIVFFAFTQNIYAQRKYNHDVTLGYGLVTSNQVFDLTADVLKTVMVLDNYSTSNRSYYGGFSLNYKNTISEDWNAGITLSYDKVTKDVFTGEEKRGDINRDFYTLGGEIDVRYFKREIFQMYSLVGIGYTYIRDKYIPRGAEDVERESSGKLNFHLSLLGFRIGKELALYTEFGFGYKGIINLGLSYQF